MINQIIDYTLTLWKTNKTKSSSNGWISGNAPCCIHNGETADKRGRGGLIYENNKLSWHCFNCNFTATYTIGRHLSFKFRKLLQWMGAPELEIKRLTLEAIRIKTLIDPDELKKIEEVKENIEFKKRNLPEDAQTFDNVVTHHLMNETINWNDFHTAVHYCYERRIDLTKYQFYLSANVAHNLHHRVIIPCIWNNEIIGYTARAVNQNITPKYYNNYELNFVFNIDNQQPDWKFVIVCEGPFDAMAIDGVAILHNEISEIQADIIDNLGREVIVVADADKSGSKLIDAALTYGWNVSFPIWQEQCKDINAAVVKYGKLFTLQAILGAKETSRLKIELLKKKLHN